MTRKVLHKSFSIIGLLAMLVYLFPLVPPQYSPMTVSTASALSDPGKFTNVSVTSTSSVAAAATTITVNFTTENALSGSGNGDVIRINFNRYNSSSGDPVLVSMDVGGSPFTGYQNSYGYYNYGGGYYEVYLDTNITGGTAVSMEISGMKNPEGTGVGGYNSPSIGIVSFSPDSGGTAYADCTDAGGGESYYGDCAPFKVYQPVGTSEISGQLFGPAGTADATVPVPWSYVNIWGGNSYDYMYSDHLGKFYFSNLETRSDYQVDFSKPWGVGYQYSSPANLTNVSATAGAPSNLGTIRFRKPAATGVVKSQATGLPIENVNVSVMNYPTPSEQTDSNGVFYLSAMSSGTYSVMFDTMGISEGNYVSPDPISITITEGTTYNMGNIFLETPNKTIKGYVRYPNGGAVTNASVNCMQPMGGGWQSDNTNASGYYELLVGKGSWQCMADHDWSMDQDQFDWVNFNMPAPVSFSQANAVAESKTQNFTVTPINATITGRVLKPNGTPYDGMGGGINVDIFTQSGFGNWIQTEPDGTFSAGVPAGTYQVMINLWDEDWGGPNPQTVSVSANSTKNLGNLYLVPKSATISGTVTDLDGNVLNNQYVDCFVAGQWGKWASGQTDSNGNFSFKAFGSATYQCSPMTSMGGYGGEGGDTYMYLGAPVSVSLPNANSTAPNTDFEMARSDATVNITAVDGSGDQVKIWGYAFVDQGGGGSGTGDPMMMGPGVGGPIDNGTGSFKLPSSMCPAASPCNVNIATPPGMGTEWSSAGPVSFSATANGSSNVSVVMLPHNATVSGRIQDANGEAITNVGAMVFADNFENMSFIDTMVQVNGTYSLSLAAGEYNMGVWLDPSLGYIASTGSASEVTAVANQTITKNLTLREIDSTINVTVLAPNGDPLPGVFVDASTSSGMKQAGDPGMMGGPMMMMGPGMMGQMTGSNGQVAVGVPGGTSAAPISYYISASTPPGFSFISPSKQVLSVVSGDETSIIMQFRESDAVISGGITKNGNATAAYVTGWAEEGGRVEDFAYGGAYSVNVTQGDAWHITAKSRVGSDFYKSKEVVITPDTAMETMDLELQLVASNIPDPVTATFSANNPAVISLDDDSVTVNIPANAISNNAGDTIKITVAPNYEVPDTDTDKVPTYGVEITAYKNNVEVESQFNSNITIAQCWDGELMSDMGLEDDDLNSKYWDGDVGAWKTPGSVATDADLNCQTASVNHLTTFSLTASELSAPSLDVTLPEDGATVSANSVVVEGTVTDSTATVTIALGGTSIGDVTVDSTTGAFSETVTGLVAGENAITVDAENGVGNAETVTRTVTYDTAGDGLGSATGIALDIVTMPKDGGPQVRIFDNEGNLLESFFAYNESLRGEFNVLTADVTGDGNREIITYAGEGFGPQVRIFDHRGTFIDDFFVYHQGYREGIEVKAADINGDGIADLVTVPQGEGGVNLRVYTYNSTDEGFELLDWEMVYGTTYDGKVNIVTADIDMDTKSEIIVAPAGAGGPNVRVYTYNEISAQLELVDWFMAFEGTFEGGVNIAVGNVSGDSTKEIVVTPMSDGGPNVRVYEYNSDTGLFEFKDWFWAYQQTYRGGVELKLADLNNDGLSEIITMPTNGSTNIRTFSYDATEEAFTLLDWFWAYAEDFRGGVEVAIANVDGDEYNEIVTIPDTGGGPNVRVFEYDTDTMEMELLDSVMAYAESFRGEIALKIADLGGDGDSEIIISPLTLGGPNVRILDYADENLAVSDWFMAYAETFRGGVMVTTGK